VKLLPIRKIRELVEGRNQEELDTTAAGHRAKSNIRAEALRYLASLLTGPITAGAAALNVAATRPTICPPLQPQAPSHRWSVLKGT